MLDSLDDVIGRVTVNLWRGGGGTEPRRAGRRRDGGGAAAGRQRRALRPAMAIKRRVCLVNYATPGLGRPASAPPPRNSRLDWARRECPCSTQTLNSAPSDKPPAFLASPRKISISYRPGLASKDSEAVVFFIPHGKNNSLQQQRRSLRQRIFL